jgi:uncharacterized membrane protein YidH (DUF202 family)
MQKKKPKDTDEFDTVAANEIKLILAEKRTSLSVMRTGIAVLILPLSVMSLLIATSEYYEVRNVLYLLMPLGLFCLSLSVLGLYLVFRAFVRMRRYDMLIKRIKMEHSFISKFLD